MVGRAGVDRGGGQSGDVTQQVCLGGVGDVVGVHQ